MRKRAARCVLWVGAALLLPSLLAACGTSSGSSSGNAPSGGAGSSKQYSDLRWGMTPFNTTLDVTKDAWYTTYEIESLAAQGLLEFEPDGKLKLALASSDEHPNPTTYVYHLKSVKFSDGHPLTAADVVYSLDRNVNGKEAWAKSYFEDVASITASNNSTVVVKLKRPLATFQKIIAFTGVVIEKSAAEEAGEKAIGTPGHLPIGTGPWKIDSFVPETSVQLSRNPYWTGARQPAANITVDFFKTEASMALALRSGSIDGASYFSPKVFAGVPGVRQMVTPGEQVTLAEVNVKRPPFNDVHVRRALAYATDSKGMIDALYTSAYATEAPLFVPNSVFSTLGAQSEVNQELASLPKFAFNIDKAKQELASSAYPHGFSTPIEVAKGVESQVASAQILAADLAKIGIKAIVHEVTHAEEGRWLTGKGIFALTDSSSNYPDPESIIVERLAPGEIYPQGGGINFANYRTNQFDRLLSEAAETLDAPKRLQITGDLIRTIRNEAPNWPLYSPGNFASLSDKYVMPGFTFWTTYYTPWALRVKLAQ